MSPEPLLEAEGFELIDAWDGWVNLRFSSRYRQAYNLQASTDLGISDPFAGLFQTTGTGPSTGILFYDPAAPRRFYRIAK